MRIARSAVLLAATLAFAAAPPSADELLNTAKNQANGRAIFAIFHASW